MPNWKILCRVTNLRTFISTKGKKCILMRIIDQKGEDIKVMYYYNNNKNINNPGDILMEGRVYSLSGGAIIQQQL
jgi:hypothetical protein